MSNPDRIAPPADAPTPWEVDKNYPSRIGDANGIRIASFPTPRHAAYAVAAANALPGLVEALREIAEAPGNNFGLADAMDIASAALAALPGEVGG